MTKALRALIVEDSKMDVELILHQIIKAGYQPTYEVVDNPAAMQLALAERSWDVIISDYSLPSFSGRAALALCQKRGCDVPFISVSGTFGEEIAVEMLKAGAHDYLLKDNLGRLGVTIARELRAAQERLKHRHAENQLAHLAAIVENSDEAIISKTLDGIILSWNRGAARMYGYAAEEMIGRPVSLLVPPSRPDELPEILETLRRGEHVERFETVRRCKDGTQIDVSISISALIDRHGKIIGASAISRNITDRRQREDERLRLITELTEALAHVKTLSGLLPICAWCKKIRDDQGYWRQLETYLMEHSLADFTHGICPECLERQHPNHKKRQEVSELN